MTKSFGEEKIQMFFIWHVILHDYLRKGSFDLIGDKSWSLVITPSTFLVTGRPCGKGNRTFLVCTWHLVTTWSSAIWLCEWEYLTLSHHWAKFDGYKSCGSPNIKTLFFHTTLCDHMIKGTCDLLSGNPSVSSLMFIDLMRGNIKRVFFLTSYHVTTGSKGHVI